MANASFSFHDISGWIEKHPYETAGAVFVGGAILVYMYYSSGTAAAPASTGANSAAAAAAAQQSAYAQEMQTQLAYEAQAGQQNSQLTALQDNLAAQTASINGAVSVASLNNAANVSIAGLNAQTLQDSINGAVSVQTAGIVSNTTLGLASIGAVAANNQLGAWVANNANFYNANVAMNQTNQSTALQYTTVMQNAASTNLANGNATGIEEQLIAKLHP